MVVLVEVTDVIDAMENHGYPFDPQAESKTGPFFRIQVNQFEHLGVDHSAPHDFNPSVTQFSEVGGF